MPPDPAISVLYIDVTSSCKSPMNTGVQRIVRELFRALSATVEIAPLIWDPALESYCALSARERGFLQNPFAGGTAADAEPGRRANPVPILSKWLRARAHRRNRVDLPAKLTKSDTLLIPEIFQDNRRALLDSLRAHSPVRMVGICYDALPWSQPEMIPAPRHAGFVEYLETLGRFDEVITISQQTAGELRACWLGRGRADAQMPPVHVLTWPVDHHGQLRHIPPVPGTDTPDFLCVATFEPRKNHLLLLEAAELAWTRGNQFALTLIGRTTPHWGARVESVIAHLAAAGRPVRWLRHVDDETLRRAYAACAFTVFPSLAEGLGLPILESLWYGRPCICGANGALGEVAAGGGCLTIDQTSVSDLSAAFSQLLNDDNLYVRLAAEARARSFATWAELAQALLPILQSRAA